MSQQQEDNYEETAGGNDQQLYQRPRRPDVNTITYLRSLPLDEKASSDEIAHYIHYYQQQKKDLTEEEQYNEEESEEPEYPTILSASLNAIHEIYTNKEVASLAGDTLGSERIESLARITCSYSTVCGKKLLYGLQGYYLHLATHRYGSHVLQTVLEYVVSPPPLSFVEDKEEVRRILELENEEEEDSSIPSIQELVIDVAQELLPYASQLAVHVCGSHVLRTLLCVLGGVSLIHHQAASGSEGGGVEGEEVQQGIGPAIRRGKFKPKKKKKKKKAPDQDAPGGNNAGVWKMNYVQNSNIDIKDENVQEILYSLSGALSMFGNDAVNGIVQPPGELQKLACHPSAGPLLIVLLRVLTYSAAAGDEATSTDKKKEQQQEEEEESSRCDRRLGLTQAEPFFTTDSPADKLAKQLLCWDKSKTTPEDQPYARDVIYGLSGEIRGSHLLETILRTCSDDFYNAIYKCGGFDTDDTMKEYVQHDVSNFVVQTLLSSVRKKEQVEILMKALEGVVTSGYVMDRSKKRLGVLWRVTEMCAKYHVGQEMILKWIRMGYASLQQQQQDKEETAEDDNKKQRHKKKNMMSLAYCIPKLLNIKPPQKDGDRIQLDVVGARSIYQLLHFVPAKQYCGDVLVGIMENLSVDELEWIANDGIGSRCIIDAILDNPKKKEAPFSDAIQKLFQKLSGRFVSLSVERVGHHTVKKLFRSLQSTDDKAMLSDELANGINRLSGNAMGRSVMDACVVREYLEGEREWRDAVKKQVQEEEWLKEIVGEEEGTSEKSGGRKRKRKRKKAEAESGKEADGDGNDNSGDDRDDEEIKKTSAVESIMDAISMPKEKKEEKKRKRKRKRKSAA